MLQNNEWKQMPWTAQTSRKCAAEEDPSEEEEAHSSDIPFVCFIILPGSLHAQASNALKMKVNMTPLCLPFSHEGGKYFIWEAHYRMMRSGHENSEFHSLSFSVRRCAVVQSKIK